MRFRFASLVYVAAVVLSVAPASGQTATLRYRWAKGDAVPYRVTQQSSSTVTGMPGMGEIVVDQTFVQGFHMTVDEDSKSDGEILFDVTKGRVQKTTLKSQIPMTMSMQGPDGTPITIQSVAKRTVTLELLEKQ